MSLIVISVDRTKLPEHTDEEFEEWVKYSLCNSGYGMKLESPLFDLVINAKVMVFNPKQKLESTVSEIG